MPSQRQKKLAWPVNLDFSSLIWQEISAQKLQVIFFLFLDRKQGMKFMPIPRNTHCSSAGFFLIYCKRTTDYPTYVSLMDDQFITIAKYEDPRLASLHAIYLKEHDVDCQLHRIEYPNSINLGSLMVAEIDLKVPSPQADLAFDLIDRWEERDFEVEVSGEGDMYTLIGAFLAMVGLITSFGKIPGVDGQIRFLPYALVILGACLFLAGMMVNQDEKKIPVP